MGALEQLSSRPALPWFLRWPTVITCAIVLWSWRGSEGDLGRLFSASSREAMGDFVAGFWPPEHSREFLESMAGPLLETVAIAFLGISLALLISLPLSFFAAAPGVLTASEERTGFLRRATFHAARLLLNLMRSIPELIWALIFVRALGIGPAAGVLAIGVGYAGVLGKVFAEIFESAPRAAVQGLATSGAGPLRAFVFGTLPSAMPVVGSYALYRFDCALRSSSILGLVGAGGIGLQLELSLKMFAYGEVAAQMIAMFVLVAAVDRLSQWVRGRLQTTTGLFPLGRRALAVRASGAALWLFAVVGCIGFLDLRLGELFSVESGRAMGEFVTALFPPAVDREFLASLGPAVLETLAISVLGTALAAGLGLLLAWPAAFRLYAQALEAQDSKRGRLDYWARRLWAGAARALLNASRTMPEVLLALVFIFAIGLGPFAGALALAVHTAGVLGRLYLEALEEVPTGPLWSLRSTGAKHFPSTIFAVLPQAFPQLLAYTLYRWEVNIRAAAALGVVGAGGLGTALHVSLSLFHNHRTLTLILVLLVLVTLVDALSSVLRRSVMAAGGRRGPVQQAASFADEAVIEGRRLLVLELSMREAQLFARNGELATPVGTVLPVELALGPTGLKLPAQARVAWRRDEMAGSYVGLTLERLSVPSAWRLYWALRRRRALRAASPALPATLEAW